MTQLFQAVRSKDSKADGFPFFEGFESMLAVPVMQSLAGIAIVGHQDDLADTFEICKHTSHQLIPNALPLKAGFYQNILDVRYSLFICQAADQADQFIFLPCADHQAAVADSAGKFFRVIGVSTPSN